MLKAKKALYRSETVVVKLECVSRNTPGINERDWRKGSQIISQEFRLDHGHIVARCIVPDSVIGCLVDLCKLPDQSLVIEEIVFRVVKDGGNVNLRFPVPLIPDAKNGAESSVKAG